MRKLPGHEGDTRRSPGHVSQSHGPDYVYLHNYRVNTRSFRIEQNGSIFDLNCILYVSTCKLIMSQSRAVTHYDGQSSESWLRRIYTNGKRHKSSRALLGVALPKMARILKAQSKNKSPTEFPTKNRRLDPVSNGNNKISTKIAFLQKKGNICDHIFS